jgi:hypothetical protein
MSEPNHEPKEDAMSVQVYIPTPFRRATNNQDRLSLEASDVEALLDELEETFARQDIVRNDRGGSRPREHLRQQRSQSLQDLALRAGRDEVSIIPRSPAIRDPGLNDPAPCMIRLMILSEDEWARVRCGERPNTGECWGCS